MKKFIRKNFIYFIAIVAVASMVMTKAVMVALTLVTIISFLYSIWNWVDKDEQETDI